MRSIPHPYHRILQVQDICYDLTNATYLFD